MKLSNSYSAFQEDIEEIENYFDRLWPLLRSITGEGVRKTHDILSEIIPLERMEIPSGTCVLDWEVPKEWVVRDAYILTPDGEKILDVWENNLQLVNYSTPFKGTMSKSELENHLYSIPELPDAIPYVTSYYKPRWGFCLPDYMRKSMKEGSYDICIDTEFIQGSMTLSEAVLKGESEREVFLSTYTCHPSMANNELSGPLALAFLYKRLAALPNRRLTYRFVFLPETIGSIAYLAYNGEHLIKTMDAGFTVTCVGLDAPFTLKKSRQGNSVVDRTAEYILQYDNTFPYKILEFFPSGSDERQYCSPGYNLPVASLIRGLYAEFPEYHTSLDNKDLISFEALSQSIEIYYKICLALEKNVIYRNVIARGEPFLAKRNLLLGTGAQRKVENEMILLQWLLNFSDGKHDLISIANRSGQDFWLLDEIAQRCLEADLIEIVHG